MQRVRILAFSEIDFAQPPDSASQHDRIAGGPKAGDHGFVNAPSLFERALPLKIVGSREIVPIGAESHAPENQDSGEAHIAYDRHLDFDFTCSALAR